MDEVISQIESKLPGLGMTKEENNEDKRGCESIEYVVIDTGFTRGIDSMNQVAPRG